MIFVDRFKKIREELGFSQEYLAEKLSISRQAVAKWEAGTAMPDILNLIEISNLFQVSLDYLLKGAACSIVTNTTTECEDFEIVSFIVEAKKSTYANFSAGKVEPSRNGSTDLAYEAGDFKYLDTYVGGANFSGTEVVYHKDSPVWSMNYSGRQLSGEVNHTIGFLTKALANVPLTMPYRGPGFFRDGKLVYINSAKGYFGWFQGFENIYYEDEHVYELVYHGGVVR